MSVVKIITLVGESEKDWHDAAIKVAKEAKASLHGITRIGITEFDMRLKEDEVEVWRVRAEVSFRIER